MTFSTNVVEGTGYELGLSPGPDFTTGAETDPGPELGPQYFRVRGGDDPTHLHFDTTNNNVFDLYVGNDSKYFKLSKDGPAVIGTNNHTVSFYDGSITSNKTANLEILRPYGIDAPASNENPDNDATDPDYVIWLVKADYANYANITTSWTVEMYSNGVRYAIAAVGNAANPNLYRIQLADQTVVIPYRANLKFYPPNSVWQFKDDGILKLPANGDIQDSNGNSVTVGVYEIITSNWNAVARKIYWVKYTSGAGFTMTLPASPSLGDWIKLYDGELKFGTTALTVNGNGNNIRLPNVSNPPNVTWLTSTSTASINQTLSTPLGPFPIQFVWDGSVWSVTM